MRLTHPDYIKLVIKTYHKKRTENDLSLLLAQSKPASIRQACLNLYQEYCEKNDAQLFRRDRQALRDFFGHADDGDELLDLIQGLETKKFKPLNNYLKGKNENTEWKNIELLAWLIDFKHRPFVTGMNVILDQHEIEMISETENIPEEPEVKPIVKEKGEILSPMGEAEPEDTIEAPKTFSMPVPKTNLLEKTSKKGLVIIFCLLISFAGIYIVRNYTSSAKPPYGSMKTTTEAQEDTIAKQKIDSLIKIDNATVLGNTIKKKARSSQKPLDSSRCLQITKKGTQCKRKAKSNGYCWQHGG